MKPDQIDSALKSAAPGTWRWDVKNDVLTGDSRMANIFRTSVKPLKAGLPVASVLEIIHPQDRRSVYEALGLSITRKSLFSATYRVIAEHEPRVVKALGRCFIGATGIQHAGVLFDITEFCDDFNDRVAPSLERLDKIAYHCFAIHQLASTGGLDSITERVQPLIQDVGYRFGEGGSAPGAYKKN
jgi:hypothetical protein